MVEVGENRFESWVRARRANIYILWCALTVLLFVLDSVLAFMLVALHYAKPERFFVTSFRSTTEADHRTIPEVRALLNSHAKVYPTYFNRFEADGLLGARLVRNFLTIDPPYFGNGKDLSNGVDRTFWFMTDENGFPPVLRLGKHYAVPKPARTFRVMILGGSTVEGFVVNTPFDSLPSKLGGLLEDGFAKSPFPGYDEVELLNAGVSNYTSDQEYLYLLADLSRFQPDLVIAYDGWNDAEVMPVRFAGEPRLQPYRTPSHVNNGDRVNTSFTPSGAFDQFARIGSGRAVEFFNNFAIPRILYMAIEYVVRRMPHPKAVAIRPEYSVRSADFYLENREDMLFLAQQRGFRFASFLQPVAGVDGKTYTAAEIEAQHHMADRQDNETAHSERTVFYDSLRPSLAAFAAKNDVPGRICISDISANTFNNVKETVYSDSGHLLPNGNEIVAEKIFSELQRCGLLPH
jgi:hypothetical protein